MSRLDFLSLILLSLATSLLAGCLSAPTGEPNVTSPPEVPPSQPALTTEFRMTQEKNFTAVIPYDSDAGFKVLNGNITLLGPLWKVFHLLRFDEDPAAGRLYIGGLIASQESAASYKENRMSGERDVTCLDPAAHEPCPPSSAEWKEFVDDGRWVYQNEQVPAGRGYFLVAANFTAGFSLNLSFDVPIRLGDVRFSGDYKTVTWDKLTSAYADVRHCGEVYACGVIIDGQYPLSSTRQWVFGMVTSLMGPAAFMSLCVGQDLPTARCSTEVIPCGLVLVCLHLGEISRGDAGARWFLNAAGPGPDSQLVSMFMFSIWEFSFDLPERHPFA